MALLTLAPPETSSPRLTWGLRFDLLVFTPFIVHGEKYRTVVHPSSLPQVDTLHTPDESSTGRACLSLSYLESPEITPEVLPAQLVMVSTKVGCDIVCTGVMLVEV